MALLRDAFVGEGFRASFSRQGDTILCFEAGKHDQPAMFTVDYYLGIYHVIDAVGVSQGTPFQSLVEAVSYACTHFGLFPSWEMEQFPLLWDYLMDED